MKLTRLIIGFLTFATALFLSHTCFVMVERGIEHIDPTEKALKEIKPETRNALDNWFNEQQVGGRDIPTEKRLQQWAPKTAEEWNRVWEDISYKPGAITGLWFSAGPLHTASQAEKAAIIDYMISKMPLEKDSIKTSQTLIDFSKQLHELEQQRVLLPIQQTNLNNALASKIVTLVEKIETIGKNPVDLITTLSDLYTHIPESLKTTAGKNLETAITNRVSTAIRAWKPETIAELFTGVTKILQTVDSLPNTLKKSFFDDYKSMISTYVTKQDPKLNWLNLRNTFAAQEQKKNPNLSLSPEQIRSINLTAYESEFQLLNSFLSLAKKLNLTNDPSLVDSAKRTLRLYKILVETGKISASQNTETTLKALVSDQQFIKANNQQSFKGSSNRIPVLPEDYATILFEDLNKPKNHTEETIFILKEIDANYSKLIEEKDKKYVKNSLHIFLDNAQKQLRAELSPDESLGAPSEKRTKRIEELEAYDKLLGQPGIFLADERALALQDLIKKTVEKTKELDKTIRDSLEQKIQTLSTELDERETSILRDEMVAKKYKDLLKEIDEQSESLALHSYERFAGNDFRNIIKAWVDVIDIAKDVAGYQAKESYKNMQDHFLSIQSELNYNANNAYDTPQARSFQSRTSMMNTQALILSKVSRMVREQRATNGRESLIALMQLPSNEVSIKRLIAEGLYDSKRVITDKGLAVRNLAEFAASVDRRTIQLQYFIQKNQKEPAPLKSVSGISLKLAQDLKLQLMIPDDQVKLLQTVYQKIVPDWPTTKDKFIDFMKKNVLTNENILQLQEISSIIDLQKRTELAQLKMPFNEPVFESVVEYTLEIARATTDKDQKLAEFFDLYKKYPSLLRVWGINDPKVLVTLDTVQLDTEKITYTKEYQRSIDDSIKAQTSILEKALLDERERKAQFLTGLVLPTFVATYDAVKSKSAPAWIRGLVGGVFALGGAVGGAILGGIAGLPGAFGGIAVGALLGFTSGAGSGWALGSTLVDKLWNLKQKPVDILDDFTGGKASIVLAGGTATWAAWKVYSAAQAMNPTEAEIESNRAKMIAAGVSPTLRQQNPNLLEKIGDTLTSWFSDEISNQQRTLEKEKGNVQQRMNDFKKARQQYCDLINEALKLKGPNALRPTSSYNYFVEVNKKLESEIKKADRSTRKLVKARIDKAFQLMTVLGRESVRLQFQYANGSAKIIGNLVYTQLLGQAAADPLSPNFSETINQGWDKLPKNFRDMFERDYTKLSDQARKEAAAQDFNTWMDFYNRIFMEHAAFSKMITDKKVELMTPLGEDGQRVYDLYQDMLSGRLDSLMTSYQLTVNEILKNWGRDPISYAGQKQAATA